MKKVLVTGLSGYLGKHLKRHIDELGWEISLSNTKVANLMDDKNLHIYNDTKFDYIFHLAAHTKAGDYCLHHKGEQFEINQRINSNILKYWREFQPQAKIIVMGTSCSYAPDLPMTEGNYLKGEPDEGLYTYAMTKRMLLVGLKSYAEQYGLKYLYYIPSTLYGPLFGLEDSHFIFDLIKKIHGGVHLGKKVKLWGDGHQRRELVYIDDAIEIILTTLSLENKVLNLGSGEDHSIREFAQIICDIIGYNSEKIFYDTTKYTGVRNKKLDTAILGQILPQFKQTPLGHGLQSTINYYEAQINRE